MDNLGIIVILVLLLVIALMVVNSDMRRWVFRFWKAESTVEGYNTSTKIRAKESTVNEDGKIDIEADNGSTVEGTKNIKK